MASYEDPIIKKYIELFKAKMPDIKQYYQGDPVRIPASSLPCMLISKTETVAGRETNVEDTHNIEMQITIITDIRSELSTQENDKRIVEGIAKLYDLMEGRGVDYSLKDSSCLDILRGNQLVDATYNLRTDLETLTRVDYGETLRDREAGLWSIEARLLFIAHFIQNR